MRLLRLAVMLSAVSLSLVSAAQDPQEALRPGAPAVTGAPFSAKLVMTTYQKLADGTTITKESVVWMARDSQGRIWSRRIVENKDPLRRDGHEWEVVVTYDPTNGQHANWCDCNRTVWLRKFGPPAPVPQRNSPGANGMDVLLGPYNDRQKFHLESEPDQQVDGMTVKVTKATRTVKAGMDGNDHDLTTTMECWWSPDLHMTLYSLIDDPVRGQHKAEIKELSRLEPNAGLWTLPVGYAVRQAEPAKYPTANLPAPYAPVP